MPVSETNEKSASSDFTSLKVLANEHTLLPTQMFPRLPACAAFVADTVQKHFVSATNVPQFAHARKRHEQQCVRNNVSSFATAFTSQFLFIDESSGHERGTRIL